MIAVWQNTDLK